MEPIDMTAPSCRVCGSAINVYVWRAEKPEETICHLCCDGAEHADGETGHHYSYAKYEGHACDYCGQEPPYDWFLGDDEYL